MSEHPQSKCHLLQLLSVNLYQSDIKFFKLVLQLKVLVQNSGTIDVNFKHLDGPERQPVDQTKLLASRNSRTN